MATKQQTIDRYEFTQTIIREFSRPSLPASRCEQIARALMRLSTQSHAWAEYYANGGFTVKHGGREVFYGITAQQCAAGLAEDDKRDARAGELVAELWAGLPGVTRGPVLECSGDCRGSAYKIRLPSGRGNSIFHNLYSVP